MLLDKGANVNAEASYGTQIKGPRTALTEAILRGDLEITKALLDKGAKVKATDLALSCQKVEILKTLLPHVKDKSDLNVVLSVAKKFSLLEAVDILEKAGAKE
jgi:ankyrin repeat protein